MKHLLFIPLFHSFSDFFRSYPALVHPEPGEFGERAAWAVRQVFTIADPAPHTGFYQVMVKSGVSVYCPKLPKGCSKV